MGVLVGVESVRTRTGLVNILSTGVRNTTRVVTPQEKPAWCGIVGSEPEPATGWPRRTRGR